MNVDKVIASLPNKTPAERRAIREHSEAWLVSGSSEQQKAAQQVAEALDDLERTEIEALVKHVSALPKAQRVVEAFKDPEMTETERAVVKVLLDNPGSTSTELTAALGWRAQAWHMHFGTMCFNRRARLWPAPPAEKRKADFYSGILADFDEESSTFTMNPDAATGFAALGLRPSGQ
jgi:hypothetical protein